MIRKSFFTFVYMHVGMIPTFSIDKLPHIGQSMKTSPVADCHTKGYKHALH
jgi:hypothetical protein